MLSTLLLTASLCAWGQPPEPGPTPEVRSLYEQARAAAGRDASAHVALAVWCEAHGLKSERLKHLGMAVLANPKDTVARGLLGLVADDGRWREPEEIASSAREDAERAALRAEYEARRAKAPHEADAQWRLGLWCAEQGLDAEAYAHFTLVTRLDPGRDVAWKRLGFVKHGRRWVRPGQVAAEEAEAKAQAEADRRWSADLARWKSDLSKDRTRAEAARRLARVTDPRAVPAVWQTFATGTPVDALRAVQLLGQIQAPAASKALAFLAVFHAAEPVRRAATETLKSRDAREFLTELIATLRDPIRYEVRPVNGPGLPGALFVEGQQYNVQRLYAPPAAPNVALSPGDLWTLDPNGLPAVLRTSYYSTLVENGSAADVRARLAQSQQMMLAEQAALQRAVPGQAGALLNQALLDQPLSIVNSMVAQARASNLARHPIDGTRYDGVMSYEIPVGQMIAEAQRAALTTERQLEADVAAVERYNRAVGAANDRVVSVLNAVTGRDAKANRKDWEAWWTDEQGYAYAPSPEAPRPTVVENVPIAYQSTPIAPIPVSNQLLGGQVVLGHSCFAAGTAVLTRMGPKAIETIRIGDEVLARDPADGTLSYQPVLAVFHNEPAATLRVDLGDEAIVATGIHRFWVAGRGWTMARDLAPGDPIRTLDGTARVASVTPEAVQPVFNLEVARGHSFLVGRRGALVHDNSLVQPVPEPFDAAPDLASLAGEAAATQGD